MLEWLPLFMFAGVCVALMLGYPVAFTLAGVALLFAAGGIVSGHFDPALLKVMPERVYGIMVNQTFVAVPLFIMMGVMLERTGLAESLLDTMARLFGRLNAGLGLSVVVVGMLLAASTGIVGATVVAMGLMSLPSMLRRGYDPGFATGTICATGTLGQIIPPSIALILLGDVLSSAYQQAQTRLGNFNPDTVSVGDLFVGALLPGGLLVVLYLGYVWLHCHVNPVRPKTEIETPDKVMVPQILSSILPPLALIVLVLGSIIVGITTPTEAAGVGAMGATCLAIGSRSLSLKVFREVLVKTLEMTSMVFLILIGASFFSLVFRGYGGEELIHRLFEHMPGGTLGVMLVVMVAVFLLGFILDFIEITLVVVPIVGPVLLAMGINPVWLGIMIAVNLQTSFLTPPFGFALFYLRSVAPESVQTMKIYKGVLPYIGIQLFVLLLLALFPGIATWLPSTL